MKLKFQNLLRKLRAISSLAFNTLQFIAALIAIIGVTGGAALVSWLLNGQSWLVPLATFIFGVFVTFLLVAFFLVKSSPPRWAIKGYKIVKTDSLYIIHKDDPSHHSFIVEVEIEAINSGVSIYESLYRWTGQGTEDEPKILSPGHTLLGKLIKQNGWKYFYIHLGHELRVGSRTTIKTQQELYDINNNFEPFLSKVITLPMDHVILHVILPEALFPSKIFFREWDSAGPNANIVREIPGQIHSHSGEIRWEIFSPVFRHRYSIDWSY